MKDILAMGAQPDLVSCQTKLIITQIKTEISTTMSGKPDQLRKLLTMPPRPRQEAKMSQKRPRMKYYLLMMEFMKKLKRKRPYQLPTRSGLRTTRAVIQECQFHLQGWCGSRRISQRRRLTLSPTKVWSSG